MVDITIVNISGASLAEGAAALFGSFSSFRI
jgi:hypothetical protein